MQPPGSQCLSMRLDHRPTPCLGPRCVAGLGAASPARSSAPHSWRTLAPADCSKAAARPSWLAPLLGLPWNPLAHASLRLSRSCPAKRAPAGRGTVHRIACTLCTVYTAVDLHVWRMGYGRTSSTPGTVWVRKRRALRARATRRRRSRCIRAECTIRIDLHVVYT